MDKKYLLFMKLIVARNSLWLYISNNNNLYSLSYSDSNIKLGQISTWSFVSAEMEGVKL